MKFTVHPDDWNLQRILWKNSINDIVSYQSTTVTYGLGCASFLALRTLSRLVQDEGSKFPLAISILTKGKYVDDIFGGADSIPEAQRKVQQVQQLCMAGGFPLQKWVSNQPQILESIPQEKQISTTSLPINKDTVIHALGLSWKPTSDTFHFTVTMPIIKPITQRTILSTITQLFDPLGLVSPVTIRAKIFIQELWSIKLDWDDSLPEPLTVKWITFVEKLHGLNQISFPRWFGTKGQSILELHGYCDASQQASAAAVYIRTTQPNGEVHTCLVCSKTKVAPIKRLTIPRLELAGAVLLTKLAAHVIRVLELDKAPNNHPSRWKDYVHNRVCLIHETLPQANWRFVPGTENPADCATRGLTLDQFSQLTIWWTGPRWLSQHSSTSPTQAPITAEDKSLEERPIQAFPTTSGKIEEPWELLHRYSSLSRLLRITALCQRFIAWLQKKGPIELSHNSRRIGTSQTLLDS